jgi:alpha-amylase/alpha-mannosidase (GH57 family)
VNFYHSNVFVRQLSQFAIFFHQDFGESPDESLENNIFGFFYSPDYVNGEEFINQINEFTKVLFSPSGRGSSWGDLGAGKWVKELNNPQVWDALKVLATEFPDHNSVSPSIERFKHRVRELLS